MHLLRQLSDPSEEVRRLLLEERCFESSYAELTQARAENGRDVSNDLRRTQEPP
jgi:hypothetical protein